MLGSTIGIEGPVGATRFTNGALQKEMALTDMGLSAVYMHELRFRSKVMVWISTFRTLRFKNDFEIFFRCADVSLLKGLPVRSSVGRSVRP